MLDGGVRGWLARLTDSPRWMVVQGAVRAQPRLAGLVVALAVLAGMAPTAFSLGIGGLVGTLASGQAEGWDAAGAQRVAGWVAVLGGLFVVQQLVGPLQGVAADALGRRYMAGVFRRSMRATLRPSTVAHLEDPELHDKVRLATNDEGTGPRAAVNGLVSWAIERFRGVVALAVVAHFNPWIALLLAAVWLHHLRRLQGMHSDLIAMRFRRTEVMRQVDYQANVLTTPGYAKEVRIFGLGGWFAERYETSWLTGMAELWAKRRDLVPKMALATLPVLAVEGLALWLAGSAAASGAIGLGALIVYAQAVFESNRFGDVSEAELSVHYGTAGLKPLRELERLVEEDQRLVPTGRRPADGLPREAIRFDGVAFSYPGQERSVFRGLTLEIPVGRSLALVGANGSGKTTLIKLLARLYDPTEGRITVDGVDLRELDARSWQRRVAAIFQDFVKYELPAYDNIALGAVERQADRALVAEVARRAGALELIEGFPKGWETVLSRKYTDGIDVSGGQWQRIALARALFAASAGAPVLIMDEPTAHLDVRAEAAFYDSFLDLTKGLTAIVISHRFSTVRRADRIVVLNEGGVLEQGSHAELLAAGGTYAHMFGLQAQRFVGERVTA